jgi:hypothetical protein
VSRLTQGPAWTLRIRGCHPLRPAFPDRSASSTQATGLLRFRSPLLAESRLMSVPPGTEMFQFPGFASTAYGFSRRYPQRVGCPIRTSTDQRLLAAPRGFSQRATSFIASWCQGIHRMPFSCSKNAHARKPSSVTRIAPRQRSLRSAPPDQARWRAQQVSPLNTSPPQATEAAGQTSRQERAETHQNLIHPDKDHKQLPPPHSREADKS